MPTVVRSLPPAFVDLPGFRPAGDGWSARCPAHDDSTASLSLAIGADGRVLVHCFAGCDAHAITRAIGLRVGDLFAGADDRSRLRFYRPVTETERAFYESVAAEQRRQTKRDAYRAVYLEADYIRESRRTASAIRAYVTAHPDVPDAWDRLASAAAMETEANRCDP